MRQLFRGLPGSGLKLFFTNFQEALRESPLKTVLIVPTGRLVALIEEELLQGPTRGFSRQTIQTLREFTKGIFRSSGTSKFPLDSSDSLLIIQQLLEMHAEQFNIIANTELGSSPTFANELSSFLSSIYSYKTNYPHCLDNLQGPKSTQLAAFKSLYEEYLDENNMIDDRGVTRWVIDYIQKERLFQFENVFIYGEFDPAPLEKELLEVLISAVPNVYYFEPYGSNEKIFGYEPVESNISPIEPENDRSWERTLEKRLYRYDNQKIAVDYNIKLFSAGDALAELRKIASMIKDLHAEGLSLQSIAVVFPNIGNRADLIREVFQDFGIPVDISIPIPLTQSPVARAVLDLMEVPRSNYELHAVLRLIDTYCFSFKKINGNARRPIQSQAMKRFALKAGATRGKKQWTAKLLNLRKRFEVEAELSEEGDKDRERRERAIKSLDEIINIISSLFETISRLSGQKTIEEHASNLIQLLDKFNIHENIEVSDPETVERDQNALKSLLKILTSLQRSSSVVPQNTLSLDEFAEVLRVLFSTADFRDKPRSRVCVQAAGPRELLHIHFEVVFLGGLTEGLFPRTLGSQYYITEDEGEQIGFLGEKGLLRQERFYFLNLLLSPRRLLVLSHPRTLNGRPMIPSAFVEDAKRLLDYEEIDPTYREQSWLIALLRAGEKVKQREYSDLRILACHPLGIPNIINRVNVESFERVGSYDSEFDGNLWEQDDIIATLTDQFDAQKVFSATMFETFANCSFRFFLKYIIHLKIPEELSDGFDALKKGSLIHDILFAYFSERAQTSLAAITDTEKAIAKDRIWKIGESFFTKPSYRGVAWDAQRSLYLGEIGWYQGILRELIDYETSSEFAHFSPAYFELEIGDPRKRARKSGETSAKPVTLALSDDPSQAFLFQGYIDRIDTTADDEFIILDYKTGRYHHTAQMIREGTSFQLPLYLLAAEQILQKKGMGGSYYVLARPNEVKKDATFVDRDFRTKLFPTVSKRRAIENFRDVLDQSLSYALDYIEAIRQGFFPPNPDLEACPPYCDYRTICRHEPMRKLMMEGGTS